MVGAKAVGASPAGMRVEASANEMGAGDLIKGSRHDRHSDGSEASLSLAKSIAEDLWRGRSARYS